MKRFFQRNWIHILIWVTMLVYLIFAHTLYPHFFLDIGKPVKVDGERPVDSNEVKLAIDGLALRTIDEQDVFVLSGWAFATIEKNDSPDKYDRTIVLTSDTKMYFFPIQTIQRQDVQDAFKDLNMDLINAGFNVIISKDVIKKGRYRIGIIFENSSTGLAYYSDKPSRFIVKTPNHLFLSEN